jgi:hypothetical protein
MVIMPEKSMLSQAVSATIARNDPVPLLALLVTVQVAAQDDDMSRGLQRNISVNRETAAVRRREKRLIRSVDGIETSGAGR